MLLLQNEPAVEAWPRKKVIDSTEVHLADQWVGACFYGWALLEEDCFVGVGVLVVSGLHCRDLAAEVPNQKSWQAHAKVDRHELVHQL